MNPILEMVSDYLRSKELQFEVRDSHIIFEFTGDNGAWKLVIDTDNDDHVLTMVSGLPIFVPKQRRETLAVFLARHNFGRRMGNFHLDSNNGFVVYCVSTPLEGLTENREVILDRLLAMSFQSVDDLFPKLCEQAFAAEVKKQPVPGREPRRQVEWPLQLELKGRQAHRIKSSLVSPP
jgi:hypothetical protein